MGIYSSVLWRFPSTHKTLGLNISEQTKNKYINKQTNKEIYKQKTKQYKKTKTRTTKNLKLYNKNQQQHKKQKKKWLRCWDNIFDYSKWLLSREQIDQSNWNDTDKGGQRL